MKAGAGTHDSAVGMVVMVEIMLEVVMLEATIVRVHGESGSW